MKAQTKNYIVPALFINECFCNMLLECELGCSTLYPTSEVSKRCQKYASGVHISSTVNIVYLVSEQNHYLYSRECRAHCATYSCLGNINHLILTTYFSYCETLALRSQIREVGEPFSNFTHAKNKKKKALTVNP